MQDAKSLIVKHNSRELRPVWYDLNDIKVVIKTYLQKDHLVFQDQRSVWGHAVYFCSEVAKDYRRLLQGQRAAM